MLLAETHIVPASKELDDLTFACKNLYNKVNYTLRQEFIATGRYISRFDMQVLAKEWPEYKAMPARVSRGVIRTLNSNWLSFFSCIKKWKANKTMFRGRPNLPKYLDKQGHFTALFYESAILRPTEKKVGIGLSSLELRIPIQTKDRIIEVQVVPTKTNRYKIRVIHDHQEESIKPNNKLYAAVDLGVNNFMAVTSNKAGFKPVVVNGGPLKSMNQFYNKKRAVMQSELPNGLKTSKRMDKLLFKRDMKVNDFMHKASLGLVQLCLKNGLNTIIIGHNELWKQKMNLGGRNNQNFASIPFDRFVRMVEYKAHKFGLNLLLQEEAYTSKCSFLDQEPIEKHEVYAGKRIKRGLFVSSTGKTINADLNGSYNIMRKAVPDAFGKGIEGVPVHPRRVKSPEMFT